MGARFRIGLANAPTPDLVHQLRNYGEYVHGIVEGKALVDMQQVDSATEFFLVEVTDKRKLGEVTSALRKGTRPTVPDSHFTLERL
jgi:hypothetical protein